MHNNIAAIFRASCPRCYNRSGREALWGLRRRTNLASHIVRCKLKTLGKLCLLQSCSCHVWALYKRAERAVPTSLGKLTTPSPSNARMLQPMLEWRMLQRQKGFGVIIIVIIYSAINKQQYTVIHVLGMHNPNSNLEVNKTNQKWSWEGPKGEG